MGKKEYSCNYKDYKNDNYKNYHFYIDPEAQASGLFSDT